MNKVTLVAIRVDGWLFKLGDPTHNFHYAKEYLGATKILVDEDSKTYKVLAGEIVEASGNYSNITMFYISDNELVEENNEHTEH